MGITGLLQTCGTAYEPVPKESTQVRQVSPDQWVIPMHAVQELAGHSDIRTTRRLYVQMEPDMMKAAGRAVATAMEAAAETEDGSE